MILIRNLWTWCLLGLVIAGGQAFAGDAELPEVIDIPYQKYILKNGLTLLVHEDHKAPIVAVNVWYHVGSKNEKTGADRFRAFVRAPDVQWE